MSIISRLFGRKADKREAGRQMAAFAEEAQAFAQAHPDTFLLMADPSTDVIFMTYKGIVAPVRIMNRDGSSNRIVHNALKHTAKNADIDRFLLAVDGGLFAIAQALYSMQRQKFAGKTLAWVKGDQPPEKRDVTLTDEAVLSPIQVVDRDGNAL